MDDTIVILRLIVGIIAAFALMAVFNALSDYIEARLSRRQYLMCLSAACVVFSVLAGGLFYCAGERFWQDGAVRYAVLILAFFAFFSLLEMVDHDKK